MTDERGDAAPTTFNTPDDGGNGAARALLQGADMHNEQVQDWVSALASQLSSARRGAPGRALLDDLGVYETRLADSHKYFRESTKESVALTYASEWVLDNYYIIRQAVRQIRADLPKSYLDELPRLESGPMAGYPRIYIVARAALAYQKLTFNNLALQPLLVALQERVPLTMGELWALPIFLRYGLVEALAHALGRIIQPKGGAPFPTPGPEIPGSNEEAVANAILSLRSIAEQDWNTFFESISRVEHVLRQDPAGVYPNMDFKSRNLYRREIEELALHGSAGEAEVAAEALALAQQWHGSDGRVSPQRSLAEPQIEPQSHVGYYLIGEGRSVLESQAGYRAQGRRAFIQWVRRHAAGVLLGSNLALTGLILLLYGVFLFLSTSPLIAVVGLLVMLVPLLTVSSSLVNWGITLLLPPAMLPKLEFKDEIPAPFRTVVAIPTLITNPEEVDSLVRQLEMHRLRNPEPGLLFALLTDFGDAPSEHLKEDSALVERATHAVEELNRKYSSGGGEAPFYFLNRERQWNASEGVWMGWERKRGKLHEFNRLLRGAPDLSFTTRVGDMQALQGVRFVVTLDSDTVLPRGAAARLAGTLAHPLNRAEFNSTGQVVSGYTILQPRMEVSPTSANRSWFTRIFAGDAGLDLYTLAVSDVYQDLTGEGIYVGKGIYDVDAFERSVAGHVPDNRLLSHDLLEGMMGRAGLVTDVTMVEDYPANYFVQVIRQRRWIRGDWQLLPWLFSPGKFKLHFSAIDRWKIIDNLRRSLLAPALLLLFILGMTVLPGAPGMWLMLVLAVPGIAVLTGLVHGALSFMTNGQGEAAFRPVGWDLLRWLLAVVFLPYEAYSALDAILTTLYRVLISHRSLLQWTSAAHTARLFKDGERGSQAWLKLFIQPVLAVAAAVLIALVHPSALLAAAPVLLLWVLAPLAAHALDIPITRPVETLKPDETQRLRRVTRRTWSFFEQFVGPEDHWLPPDHFQESPVGMVAHRTSPTNIGLLLVSTLAAYDLGYVDQFGLITRLNATFETMDDLDRYRGHFLNWYDTLTLKPLNPRYVSTVDSGNLAASLIITAQACKTQREAEIFCWEMWEGYLDTLSILIETMALLRKAGETRPVNDIEEHIGEMRARILAAKDEPHAWFGLFQEVIGPFWQDLSKRLLQLVSLGQSSSDLDALRLLQQIAVQIERHHLGVQRTITELTPWIPLLEQPPVIFSQPGFKEQFAALREVLSYNPALGEIRALADQACTLIETLRQSLPDVDGQAAGWLDQVQQAVERSEVAAGALINGYERLAEQAERYIQEMDFHFLFDPRRRIFHIGYNLDAGQLDANYYDLLASEARIASILAIALGEVPQSHWLHLNRPVARVEGLRVLLSWSATMFEYLMPPLFLRNYNGTLLSESARGAVLHQIAYGKTRGVPWGISESGFYRFDANQNYQYRAFGTPGLGFKRGLSDDLVISPYSSLMAVCYAPRAVHQNILDLTSAGGLGLYGFYEAIDFTTDRLPLGQSSAVVREYMSHHQGMVMLAMVNYFHDDIMVRRMHSDPRIQAVDLLLQEQVPLAAEIQSPYAEDVKGVLRLTQAPVEVTPWTVPAQTPIPQVHLLSNGSYSTLLTNAGGGFSQFHDVDLTRWRPDGVLDPWGTWVYIQDTEMEPRAGLWSATLQPLPENINDIKVTFFAHMVVVQRSTHGVTSTLEVTVPPEDAVEIRRMTLNNSADRSRRLRLTSYGEVILAQQATDARHPAFNKLFIESEFIPELNLQIFKRRPRSSQEEPLFFGHMLVINGARALSLAHEADRYTFIGRDNDERCPAALFSPDYLSGSSGATLDPIFALGQQVDLGPHESAQLAYLNLAAGSREELITLAQRYHGWALVDRAFHQADIAAQNWLGRQNLNTEALQNIMQVLSALLYPFSATRAAPEIIAANRMGQPGLWRFGVSGDYPIMLVNVDDPKQLDLVVEALQTHRYLRSRRFMMDVVILNQQQTNYGAELNGMLYRLVSRTNSEQWLNQRGGIFVLYADQMQPEERTLLQTAARVVVSGSRGSLKDQLPGYSIQVAHLPEFNATREPIPVSGNGRAHTALAAKAPAGDDFAADQFFNGFGRFSEDGREYLIDLLPGQPTPAPWVNIIGYPEFGFMVSEAGSQTTWALNSGENRLTPWSNDPVRDPTGEALYLRDEETGEVWTPTPLPSGTEPFQVRHGAGYTIFEHESHQLAQQLRLFASPTDPVKFIHLRLENTADFTRRITATQFIEWVLGTTHAISQPYIIPEYDAAHETLLATNPYNPEFSGRAAFLAASKPVHGLTADRVEFIGRNGTLAAPVAFRRIGLESRISPGEDPCAVLQVHIDLPPGGVEEIYFILGQGADRSAALGLVEKYHDAAQVQDAWEATQAFWDGLLDTVQVRTPNPAMGRILNRWLLYQALSCRVWGRTAFFQSSGAFGFRDQLQDVLAALPIDPTITRAQILNAAAHQFEAGDVLHWWHPPSGRGVRTRFSDDLLWLPYAVALYVEATGDWGILDEQIAFLSAPPLNPGEDERYGEYQTGQTGTLFEHCRRAIEKGATTGAHGLPLMGTGDWNDGMNRVGIEGRGESVWLAWFLVDVLNRFAALCESWPQPESDAETDADALRPAALAGDYRAKAVDYARSVEQNAWDGAWYRRAYYDDGTPLGSQQNAECKIDAIAQSWSVISAGGEAGHTRRAMMSVLDKLVIPTERLSLLFTPPFDKTHRDPGYIKGYLPGIRENGGQYTHAAIWTGWAFTALGEGKQAAVLFDLLNPVNQADTTEKAQVYRVEPYVVCADIYSVEPYVRRGGWTWYTGSAAWLYRFGVEAILGLRRVNGDQLRIDPVIPPEWEGFEIDYRFGKTTFHIQVSNPRRVMRGIHTVQVDGRAAQDGAITLVDDGQAHTVIVTMGAVKEPAPSEEDSLR